MNGLRNTNVLFFAGLFFFSQVNTSIGYAAGRAGSKSTNNHDGTIRKATVDEGHKSVSPDEMTARKSADLQREICIFQNKACQDIDGRALRSFTSINNQQGCDEKCTETDGCKW